MATSLTDNSSVYSRQFYERIDGGSRQSAARVVPKVIDAVMPKSVVDIGCGTGAWLAEFQHRGVEILGVDGPWVPQALLHIPADKFIPWNFELPLRLNRQFDLVVCLEFAEHLPESAAEPLVESLTSLSSVVLFSAAVPGQGGDGHLNEKPLAWWEELFARRDFRCHRGFGAQFTADRQVEWWYSRNMVFFVRDGALFNEEIVDSSPLPNVTGSVAEAHRIRLEDIQPAVMTCAASMPYVRDFAASYQKHIGSRLPSPAVVVDLTASNRLPSDYLSLLMELEPRALHVHPRVSNMSAKDSVNDAAFYVLACGLSEMQDRKYLLFVEDDVVFSSQLIDYLSTLELSERLGLLTLYSPGSGYGSEVIRADQYYGTQCLLFPRTVLQPILDNRSEMEHRFSPNYDLRWAQWLGLQGFEIRASAMSYAQHIGRNSRIGCNFHESHTFLP